MSAQNVSRPFDVILFDVGGVMLTNGWDHQERAVVCEQFGLDKEEFEKRHPKPYDAWERDWTDVHAYLDAVVFYESRDFTRESFIEAMKQQSVPIPENAMPVLREVAQRGDLLTGLLNNESRLLHEYRMRKFELNGCLDMQLSSCYLGMRKPDREIYLRAIDILGVDPARIVFIDDRQGNVDAALATGMHGIQFAGEEGLRKDLRKLGIL